MNFTFGAAGDMDRYRRITDLTDFASFTYYPLAADFTMRDPSVARDDIDRMLGAAAGQQAVHPGDRLRLGGPIEELAAEAGGVLHERVPDDSRAARSDRRRHVPVHVGSPQRLSLIISAGPYRLPNSDNFKAYIQTLGILQQDGTPKPAWDVFRREALAIKGAR